MRKFKTFESIAAYIDRKNIDTDAIIPKQYLKAVTREGFGENLFDDWRYLEPGNLGDDHSLRKKNPEFFLYNPKYRGAKILITGDNFGCGSSREHAVWALMDYGFDVVISTSFADIFYNNCFKNGILPITISEDQIKEISEYSNRKEEISVNLPEQTISFGNKEIKFEIDQFKKKCLIEGLDDIALSLEKSEKIISYENKIKEAKPWIFND